jgi:hypothetical protein
MTSQAQWKVRRMIECDARPRVPRQAATRRWRGSCSPTRRSSKRRCSAAAATICRHPRYRFPPPESPALSLSGGLREGCTRDEGVGVAAAGAAQSSGARYVVAPSQLQSLASRVHWRIYE